MEISVSVGPTHRCNMLDCLLFGLGDSASRRNGSRVRPPLYFSVA